MAKEGFTFTTTGMKRVLKELKGFDKRVDTFMDTALRDVLDIARDEYDKQFQSEGARFGQPWKPLAPATLKIRKRLGFQGTAPLTRSGLFRRSTSKKGAKGSRSLVRKNTAVLQTVLKFSDYSGSKLAGSRTGLNVLDTHEKTDRRTGRPARKVVQPLTGVGWQGVRRIENRMEEGRDDIETSFKKKAKPS